MLKKRIIYVMGVSGSGKSTLAQQLAAALQLPFADGDDFHSPANVEKMSKGNPLQDADRVAWLQAIHQYAITQLNENGAVIACSALKEKYRRTLEAGMPDQVDWIYLRGSFSLIKERMKQRKDHFMPEKLLVSQFETLEEPLQAMVLDIEKSPEELLEKILGFYQK